MFDKFRENAKYQQVKQHLEANKTTYLIGAGGLVVGVGIGLLLKQRPTQIINMVAPEIKPIINPVIAPVFDNTINNGGYTRKIIRCLETGEMWPSMKDAASSTGSTLQRMSNHIHGRNPHLHGLHYVIEGLSAN